uniref:FAD-dependent oxidoreductase n=1 Tax=uncultured Altererythrobacter sp. TaxID=500840 RepID=UPI002628391A|nr:FAD-dependent oxidoreductase [uncultured Altererythrobacter sp.]
MGQAQSAIVIGGGIIGVTSAFALARDGWRVRLLDSASQVASGASRGNGRQLSYSHTNALASPRLLGQIPKLLLGCDQAFRLSPRADRGFARWVAQFLGNCTNPANRRNTLATLKLADQSRQAMDVLLEKHPIEFARKQVGKFVLLRSQADLLAAKRSLIEKRKAGLRQELLSPSEAFAIEPALEQATENLFGALYAPDDETGDCQTFAAALLRLCEQEYGVKFSGNTCAARIGRRADTSVVTLETGEELTADLIVAANGHGLNRLTAPLGHWLPVEPMKGYSFTASLGNSAPLASVTDHARRIVFTHLGDRMLVAGIAEMGRVNSQVEPDRLRSMIAAARLSLPQAAVYDQADEGWAGMRPMTPNSQPIIRMLEPGIAVNGGQGMLGWTLAMGSAERLAKIVGRAG